MRKINTHTPNMDHISFCCGTLLLHTLPVLGVAHATHKSRFECCTHYTLFRFGNITCVAHKSSRRCTRFHFGGHSGKHSESVKPSNANSTKWELTVSRLFRSCIYGGSMQATFPRIKKLIKHGSSMAQQNLTQRDSVAIKCPPDCKIRNAWVDNFHRPNKIWRTEIVWQKCMIARLERRESTTPMGWTNRNSMI